MTNPADIAERRLAIDPRKSFAVSAPAGSGKTSLITQRILALLSICKYPEEILAVTFTRKAASEMRHRVITALNLGLKDEAPSDSDHDQKTWQLAKAALLRDSELGWGLKQNPNRLKITTIDGFCRSVAMQLPLESGLGCAPNTLEFPLLAYQRASRNLLGRLESDNEEISSVIEDLLEHLDNDLNKAENLLSLLLGSRDQWLPKIYMAKTKGARKYLDEAFEEIIGSALNNVADRISVYESSICAIADYAGTNLLKDNIENNIALCAGLKCLPICDSMSIKIWQGLVNLFITGDGTWRKSADKRIGIISGNSKEEKEIAKSKKSEWASIIDVLSRIDETLLDDLNNLRILPSGKFTDSEWRFISALTTLLPVLAAELDLIFKEEAATDFNAITLGAINALGENEEDYSELLLKMDNSISHILIDEFQDTSSTQLHLVKRLTEGWQRDDGRTIFIVGDGQQSIYGFRNANVGIFLKIRQGLLKNININTLDLRVNFRSEKGVVDWVNSTFEQAFPKKQNITRGAVPYSCSVAYKAEGFTSAVTCHLFKENSSRTDEANQVVKIIKELRSIDVNSKIAILIRNRHHLPEIFERMRDAGIKWTANEIEPLASRQCIMDVMSLTRAMINANDRIAWLSILRAPWCGLNLHDLYSLTNYKNEGHQPVDNYGIVVHQLKVFEENPGISIEGKEILRRVSRLILKAWESRGRKDLSTCVEGLWIALSGPSTLSDENDLININTYFEFLRHHEEAGKLKSLTTFENAISKLYAAPNLNSDKNLVVMSIHASKGLEFDHVIMPSLDRGSRVDEMPLLLWQDIVSNNGNEYLLMSALPRIGEEESQFYNYLRNEKNIKNKLENSRLLYVGCTRTIKSLHLLGNATFDEKTNDFKIPSCDSLLFPIWNTFKTQAIIHQNETKYSNEIKNVKAKDWIKRIPIDSRIININFDNTLQQYRGTNDHRNDTNQPDQMEFLCKNERHIGIVLHRILYHIGRNWNKLSSSNLIPSIKTLKNLLKQTGYTGETDFAIKTIISGVENSINSKIGRWVLGGNHKLSEFESKYLVTDGNEVKTKIIDRTFICNDNIRWIIDYKSSSPDKDETIDQFLEHEITKYRSQLVNYRNIFIHEENVKRCAIYFPLLGILKEI